jgi:hypothetical protein
MEIINNVWQAPELIEADVTEVTLADTNAGDDGGGEGTGS